MRIKILGCSGGIGGDLRTTSMIVDDDILNVSAELFNRIHDEIVREWARVLDIQDSPFDAHRFEETDHDGEISFPVRFAEDDHLRIVHFADDDPAKFHLNRHSDLTNELLRR